ncbi:uncharacterized protein LOC117110514 [Anneissia japonica]|uniref:uncharacterized protein LOC117110514 n=1 Tax=Anneissia japonica TaxID=1529436 RepID=UPI0014255869|nr:uncharacterized protein LOC117110514 [Anneissia japonica]XP_033109159.1 uncharacterized protein LOC117110514 [Anneissia japonica]
MFSSIFKKTQQSRENKRAFENLQRTVSLGYGSQEVEDENQEEQDGFLMVGETEKERNTIKPLAFPPSYEERQQYALCSQASPTMTVDLYGSSAEQASSPSNSFQSGRSATQSCHTPDQLANACSALSGVPFKLSSSATLIFGGTSTLSDMSIPSLKTFEPKKFDYDFSHEHSVVTGDL